MSLTVASTVMCLALAGAPAPVVAGTPRTLRQGEGTWRLYLPHVLTGTWDGYKVLDKLAHGELIVAEAGGWAYALVGEEFLTVDLRDLQQPTVVSRVPVLGVPFQIAVVAGRLVALRFWSLDVYDLTDPARPRPIGSVAVTGDMGLGGSPALAAYNGYVLVSNNCGFLRVIDVQGAAPGQVVGQSDRNGHVAGLIGHLAVLHHGHCDPYQHEPDGFVAIDLQDPAHPRTVGELPIDKWNHDAFRELIGVSNTPFGVMFLNDLGPRAVLVAAATDGTLGLSETIDIGGGYKQAIADRDGRLYVTLDDNGRARTDIVSLGTGANPAWHVLGSIVTPGRTVVSASAGRLVALDFGFAGSLSGIDVSNPAAPAVGAEIELIPVRSVAKVAAADGLAYVLDAVGRLVVLDYRTSATPPKRRGRLDTVPWQSDAAAILDWPRLYVLDQRPGPGGLWVLNVADPDQPRLSGSLQDVNGSHLVVAGHLLLVITPNSHWRGNQPGLTALSLMDPDHPTLLDHVAGFFTDMAAVGDLAVATGPCRDDDALPCLTIFRLTDGRSMRSLAVMRLTDVSVWTWPDSADPVVAVTGDRAYVAINSGDDNSLWVVADLTEPTSPRVVDSRYLRLDHPDAITTLDETRLLVSAGDSAVVVVDPIVGSFIAHRFPAAGGVALDGPVGYVAVPWSGLWRLALGPR